MEKVVDQRSEARCFEIATTIHKRRRMVMGWCSVDTPVAVVSKRKFEIKWFWEQE